LEQWRELNLGRYLEEQEKRKGKGGGVGGGVEEMEVDEEDLYS